MTLAADPRLQRAVLDQKTLAESVAWRYIKRLPGVEADEILSLAYEALCQCSARWIDYCARNGFNPWDEDDPGRPEKHWPGFVSKRVSGMIMDHCRKQDWVSRSTRGRLKAIAVAQEAGARTEAELAAATGLTAERIREALAAERVKPVSLDDNAPSADFGHQALADGGADVESQAGVRETLATLVSAMDSLDAETQVVLALWYHAGLEPAVVARELRTSGERVSELHDAGVLAIHNELLLAVQAEGTGPRRPAPSLPPVRIRSADCCQAAERAAEPVPAKRCSGPCGRVLPLAEFSFRKRQRNLRVPYCGSCDRARQRRYAARAA